MQGLEFMRMLLQNTAWHAGRGDGGHDIANHHAAGADDTSCPKPTPLDHGSAGTQVDSLFKNDRSRQVAA